jgi:tetraacyldisaccharide 4'-kinase
VSAKEIFDRMIRILCEPREMPRPVYGSELAGLPSDQ